MEKLETLKEEIKEIIYACAKKGGMCDEIEDGQIIGLRTGKGLEFDMVTLEIAQWYCDKMTKMGKDLLSSSSKGDKNN